MKTMRKGSHQRITQNLRRHAELMAKYEERGFSREEASKRAFKDIMNTRG